MKLRDYQEHSIESVLHDWQTYWSLLAKIPTGGGKTIVFLELLHRLIGSDKRALVIAHRKELIDQPHARVAQFWPDMAHRTGIVMADRKDNDAQLIVATIQTLAIPGRLETILEYGKIDYVVIDEAHHAIRGSAYDTVVQRIREHNQSAKVLGVTATPQRGDGAGLGGVFERVSVDISIKDLIKLGHLVPPRWLAIQTGIDLSGLSKHSGDFTQKELADVFDVDNCFDLVVESHLKFAGDRRGIAFVTSVAGAYNLAEKFRAAGVSAQAADGTTGKADRAAVLADFRAGRTQVLVNVALWTEGLDVPEISLIHQVRPTQSDGLYVQMIGRGLRPVPGKEDCLILDYAPKETRNIVMAGDVLGVPAKKEAYVKKNAERGEVVGGFTYDGKQTKWLDGSPYELISRQLDYMSASPWKWTQWDGHLVLGLGTNGDGVDWTLVMKDNRLIGVARSTAEVKDPAVKAKCNRAYLIKSGEFDELAVIAEDIANKRGNPILVAKNRKWRKQAPSAEQIALANKLGIRDANSMSKGMLAEVITAKLALNVVRRGVAG